MEEDLQNSSNDKKTAFLNKPVDKKILIIIVCSLLCFLLAILLFSFIGGGSKKTQIQSSSRPSIHAPKKASKKNIEKTQLPEQRPQVQVEEPGIRQRTTHPERIKRGRYKNETPEEEHQRHLREIGENLEGLSDYDNPQREQDRRYRERRERPRRNSSQRSQQTESERPKLNS